MTYIKAYNIIKETLESLGYTAYPTGMSRKESMVLPYGEIAIYDPRTISMTQGKSTVTNYKAFIRIKERVREHNVTESDITLIPKRNGERDANIRNFLQVAGLVKCKVRYGMGYTDNSNNRTLITTIEGEI